MWNVIFAVLLGFVCSTAGVADTLLELRSNANAKVYLDGAYVGRTPMNLPGVRPGNHDVRLVDPATETAESFSFWSPRDTDLTKRYDATFSPRKVAVRQQYEDRYHQGRQIYRNHDGRRYWVDSDGDRHYLGRNYKSRVRNVSIGTTVFGLATGSGFLTGMGLGGIIANESR